MTFNGIYKILCFYLIQRNWVFGHKLEFYNPYIFATGWRKPLIFQTYMIWSNRNQSLKYLRSMSLGCKDIGIRKSKFVAKTQFLYLSLKRYTWKPPKVWNISKGKLEIIWKLEILSIFDISWKIEHFTSTSCKAQIPSYYIFLSF